jgi:hypothetical protein
MSLIFNSRLSAARCQATPCERKTQSFFQRYVAFFRVGWLLAHALSPASKRKIPRASCLAFPRPRCTYSAVLHVHCHVVKKLNSPNVKIHTPAIPRQSLAQLFIVNFGLHSRPVFGSTNTRPQRSPRLFASTQKRAVVLALRPHGHPSITAASRGLEYFIIFWFLIVFAG